MRKKATWIIPSFLAMVLLSLFLVLPTLAAPSAVTGSIKLTGGAGALGLFYSDKATFNVAKATVTDADNSTRRTGKARFDINSTTGTVTTFDLNRTTAQASGAALPIVGGEKAKSDTFSGDASTTAFTLTKKGRDANDDGALTATDVTAKVAGVTATIGSVTLASNGTHISVVTLSSAPASGTKNVVISYETSEYDITTPANTPLYLAGSSIVYGSAFSTATNSKTIEDTDSTAGTVKAVSGIASTNKVVVTFQYDVTDTASKLVTFSTATLSAKGLTRALNGVETGATTGKFEASVGFFTSSDFDKIVVSQLKSTVTTIDALQADLSTALNTRVGATALALGFAATGTTGVDQNEDGSDNSLVALLVPIADGEVVTATYDDGGTSRSDTADIDLKAPTITLTSPATGSYTNALAQSFLVTITDEASAGGKAAGLASGDADTLVVKTGGGTGTSAATSLVPMLLATNSYQVSRSVTFVSGDEGAISWWVTTTDKVGNIPTYSDSRTAAQKAQGVANPAVAGAGNPASATTAPGNPYKITLDVAAPAPITNAAKTGAKIDTRLSVIPTGSHTGSADAAVLTDSQGALTTAKVAVGDKVTNLTDGSTCTLSAVTATTATCSLGGGAQNDWDTGDNYKITNPTNGNVAASNTAKNTVSLQITNGTGAAKIDTTTLGSADFGVAGSTVTAAVLDKAGTTILLTLAADLGTADKPKVSVTGEIKDLAGNKMATVTGTNAIAALDGLAPVIPTPSITSGTASGRAASNGTVTITFSAGEASASTPTVTAAYLKYNSTDSTLTQDTTKALTVTSNGINAWKATLGITTITGSSTAGLANIVINLTDAAGNTATSGVADPDGTAATGAGKIKSTALVVEFDNTLNEGEKDVADVFVVSPNTGTLAAPTTDSSAPFITVNFDTGAGGGEDKEFTAVKSGDATKTIELDTHKGVTVSSAVWTYPDGTTADVLSSINSADLNSYVYAPSGLVVGTHKLTIQAKDDVGNISVSVGSTTATSFVLSLKVTARADYKVPIKPGFNLISIPAAPAETDLNKVILSTSPIDFVMTYENSTGLWLVATRDTDAASDTNGQLVGNLTTFDATHAYWVKSDRFLDLKVQIPRSAAGIAQFPTVIPVYGTTGAGSGWNVVPVGDPAQSVAATNIDADSYFSGVKWSAAFTFDTAANAFVKTVPEAAAVCEALSTNQKCLDVGAGYFLYVTTDGVIIP